MADGPASTEGHRLEGRHSATVNHTNLAAAEKSIMAATTPLDGVQEKNRVPLTAIQAATHIIESIFSTTATISFTTSSTFSLVASGEL